MKSSRQGWVYVQSNTGLIGYKIGRTIRCTTTRAKENTRGYGTLHPFVTVSKHMVSDNVAVETLVHRKLAYCRNEDSEMFECDLKTAQKTIMWAAKEVLGRPSYIRLWRRLTAPRPTRAPERWRRTGRYSRGSYLWPVMLAIILLAIVGLSYWKPALPDWLPEPVINTAARIERWTSPLAFAGRS